MQPRRSLRIRQLNDRMVSTVVTSSSTRNVAEKRTRTKSMADANANADDVAIQPKQKKIKFNNVENNPIAAILLLPVEILEQIFIEIDDIGFLNLANTCTRFEAIALAVASKRYADKYFVINRY